MTDYLIEAATKEEWAERALRAEAKLAKAADGFITVNRMAKKSGFGPAYITCHGCCDIYHLTNSTLAELAKERSDEKGETDE